MFIINVVKLKILLKFESQIKKIWNHSLRVLYIYININICVLFKIEAPFLDVCA